MRLHTLSTFTCSLPDGIADAVDLMEKQCEHLLERIISCCPTICRSLATSWVEGYTRTPLPPASSG
jgi:hypothetical protein